MGDFNFRSYVLITVLLTVAVCNSSCVTAGPEYHVHIFNGLSNDNVLNVHCRSKDDDLGQHAIAYSAEFSWKFQMNIFGTTLFWCNMNWAEGYGSFKVFWFDEGFLQKCNYKNCIWVAQDDGVYLNNIPEGKFELVYKWSQ